MHTLRQSCSCARTSRTSWAAWKISSPKWPSWQKACRCSVVCSSWISSYSVARPAGFPCSMSSNRNCSLRCSCIDNSRVSLPALWNVRFTVCQTADINNMTYYLQDICMCEMAHFQLTWSCQRHVGDVACAFAHNGIHTHAIENAFAHTSYNSTWSMNAHLSGALAPWMHFQLASQL